MNSFLPWKGYPVNGIGRIMLQPKLVTVMFKSLALTRRITFDYPTFPVNVKLRWIRIFVFAFLFLFQQTTLFKKHFQRKYNLKIWTLTWSKLALDWSLSRSRWMDSCRWRRRRRQAGRWLAPRTADRRWFVTLSTVNQSDGRTLGALQGSASHKRSDGQRDAPVLTHGLLLAWLFDSIQKKIICTLLKEYCHENVKIQLFHHSNKNQFWWKKRNTQWTRKAFFRSIFDTFDE